MFANGMLSLLISLYTRPLMEPDCANILLTANKEMIMIRFILEDTVISFIKGKKDLINRKTIFKKNGPMIILTIDPIIQNKSNYQEMINLTQGVILCLQHE